jgi:MFS family permease
VPAQESPEKRYRDFEFNLRELAGSMGDFGTLFPLAVGYIAVNGLNPSGLFIVLGLTNIASQLAAVAGPTINGYIVEWGGGDYNLIFVVTPAFFVLAILCMLGVTQGEAKQVAAI